MEKKIEILQDFLKEYNLDANVFYVLNIYPSGIILVSEDKEYLESKLQFEKSFPLGKQTNNSLNQK